MAMPMPELASEKAWRLIRVQGAGMGHDNTEESLVDHQESSSDTPFAEEKRAKGIT